MYPFAIVPFTYLTSPIFKKGSFAQVITLFTHLGAAITAIGVFFLRSNRDTENLGDSLSYLFKILPSYCFSNALLYAAGKEVLNDTR